jgi:hypothetical protein
MSTTAYRPHRALARRDLGTRTDRHVDDHVGRDTRLTGSGGQNARVLLLVDYLNEAAAVDRTPTRRHGGLFTHLVAPICRRRLKCRGFDQRVDIQDTTISRGCTLAENRVAPA